MSGRMLSVVTHQAICVIWLDEAGRMHVRDWEGVGSDAQTHHCEDFVSLTVTVEESNDPFRKLLSTDLRDMMRQERNTWTETRTISWEMSESKDLAPLLKNGCCSNHCRMTSENEQFLRLSRTVRQVCQTCWSRTGSFQRGGCSLNPYKKHTQSE